MSIEQNPDVDLSTRVFRKQIDLLYDNQPFALFVTVLIVVLVIGFLSSSADTYTLALYFSPFPLVILARFYIGWHYSTRRKNNTVDFTKAVKLYIAGVVFTGVSWSIVALAVFPVVDLKGQILLLIVIMGVAAVAHTTMGYLKAPVVSFIILLELPLAYVLYLSSFPNTVAVMLAVILHLMFITRSSIIFYNSTYNMLRLNEIASQREHKLLLQTAEANAANEEKSKFLSRMSHELRTPLNAILGMNELLLRDKNEPLTIKQSDRSKKVADAGKHLLSIVDDVLDLSRIESGSVDVTLALVNCQSVIEDSIKLVEGKAVQRNINISYEASHSEVFVMADSKRLKQTIVNLLDNAVKYNKQGGTVSIVLKVVANRNVRISIVDTGYGISEESIDKLFKPFSRLGADKLGIDGTGIGLNLSKQLIELMNGHIGVENKPGKGCCFWVELPYVRYKGNLKENEIKQQPEREATAMKITAPENAKILLVEDNLVNCEVAVDMLEEMGFVTDVVNNGQEAVETYDKNQHVLILMDCEMPVMDGFTATEQIRKNEIERQQVPTPIIALTAHAVTGAKDKCMISGMDDFLSKPFSMATLQSIMSKWLVIESKVPEVETTSNDVDGIAKGSLNTNSANSLILDQEVVNRLCSRHKKDGSNLANRVVNIYLEQSTQLLDDLTQATQRADVEAVRTISHALKSSSINVGATGLSTLCKEIEHNCEQGQIENTLVEQVHQVYSDVEKALNDVLQSVN